MPEFIVAIPAQDFPPNRSDKSAIHASLAQQSFSPKEIYRQSGMGYPSAMIWEVRFMTVVKSDAMLQYEKGIGEIISKRPKRSHDEIMHIEWGNYLMVAAAIIVVVIAATSM